MKIPINNHLTMSELKELFLLEPEVIFLNHGSFGATPRPVMDVYQNWQHKLEQQPVKFLDRELPTHYQHARTVLGKYLNVEADDLVYIPNATFGVNVIGNTLKLGRGDEILSTDHEYGACDKAWEYLCQRSGSTYIRQPVLLPVSSQEEIIEQLWRGVTPRTKLIFISHITSPTALTLPVEIICERARKAGILTLIDGAHAPGHIPVDLIHINADFYTGNCHKWLMAPKGSAFLYANKSVQNLIEPLVVSWGWRADPFFTTSSTFLDYIQWWGTYDPSAYLTVPAAIDFQEKYNWAEVRKNCHNLVKLAIQRINNLTGLQPLYPEGEGYYYQMAAAYLPSITELRRFKTRLYDDFHIEVPCIEWNNHQLIRLSVQGYNSAEDIEALITALEAIIPESIK